MQIVRTIIWVLLLVALLIFSISNWNPLITVRIWENLVVETKIPVIVIASFLIGFVPMWLVQLGMKWSHKRHISALENKLNASNAIIAQMTAATLPHEAKPVPEVIAVSPEVAPIVVEPSAEPLVDRPTGAETDRLAEPNAPASDRKFLRDDPSA